MQQEIRIERHDNARSACLTSLPVDPNLRRGHADRTRLRVMQVHALLAFGLLGEVENAGTLEA
jgi:hypothetical protein